MNLYRDWYFQRMWIEGRKNIRTDEEKEKFEKYWDIHALKNISHTFQRIFEVYYFPALIMVPSSIISLFNLNINNFFYFLLIH